MYQSNRIHINFVTQTLLQCLTTGESQPHIHASFTTGFVTSVYSIWIFFLFGAVSATFIAALCPILCDVAQYCLGPEHPTPPKQKEHAGRSIVSYTITHTSSGSLDVLSWMIFRDSFCMCPYIKIFFFHL